MVVWTHTFLLPRTEEIKNREFRFSMRCQSIPLLCPHSINSKSISETGPCFAQEAPGSWPLGLLFSETTLSFQAPPADGKTHNPPYAQTHTHQKHYTQLWYRKPGCFQHLSQRGSWGRRVGCSCDQVSPQCVELPKEHIFILLIATIMLLALINWAKHGS